MQNNTLPLISLDRIYFPYAAAFLEVTRKTNPENGKITIAARPGTRPLNEQLNRIPYEEVVLGDVGAFEGNTLATICSELESRKIKVKEIYLGFSTPEANKKLNCTRKVNVLNIFNFYEWIELRDLFGIDGRAVGLEGSKRTFIPYWENLTQWASIPKENETSIIELCKEFNYRLLAELKANGKDMIKIGKAIKFGGKG